MELAKRRVAARVASGDHNIPTPVIESIFDNNSICTEKIACNPFLLP